MANGQTLQNRAADTGDAVTCDALELSLISGVGEQTLQRYDRSGLLQPDARTNSGQLRYSRESLIQLERLAMMQLLGFSGAEIKSTLNALGRDLIGDLRLQKELCGEMRRRLNHLIYFLEQADEVNCCDRPDDWHYLGRVVDAIQKLQDPDYFKETYLRGRMPRSKPFKIDARI